MGEYYPGEITIGGPVPMKLFSSFCLAIASADVSLDWDDVRFKPTTMEDIAGAVLPHNGCLHLMDSQARDGQFHELEKYLVEQDIAFDRVSDPHLGSSGVIRQYRPGMGVPVESVQSDGQAVVSTAAMVVVLNDLKRITWYDFESAHNASTLKTISDAGLTKLRSKIDGCISKMEHAIGTTVPPLTPLSFVFGTGQD